METAILEMLKRSAAIPSIPQVAARFLEIVQDPDFDYRDVVEVLSADAGTASEILRLANSSLFGVTRHVSSLPHALTLLGLRRVRSLVLGRYIVESIDHKRPTCVNIGYFWQRSLITGVLAAQFTRLAEPNLQEEAFIAGLLADVGVIVLDETMPTDYGPLAAQYRPHGPADLARQEVAQIGISHGHASALVLEHWQLPEIVCEAVSSHPWELEEATASPLARWVGAADLLAKHLSEEVHEPAVAARVAEEIQRALRISPSMLAQILHDIEPQIQEFGEMLRVKTLSTAGCQDFAQLLQQSQVLQPASVI